MRRSARLLLSWLVSVSFVLTPYSTLHAHISDHEHTHIHGGHVHDPGHETRSLDQVVNVSVPATAATALPGWEWSDWLAVLCTAALLALSLPFLTTILRPPSRATEPISNRSRRQPPLRGPPLSIPAL